MDRKMNVGFQYGYTCGSAEVEQQGHILKINDRQKNYHNTDEATLIYNAIVDYPILINYLH